MPCEKQDIFNILLSAEKVPSPLKIISMFCDKQEISIHSDEQENSMK